MTKIAASVMINRPVEDVWKFVTNFSNASQKIFPNVLEVKQTSPGPLGVGTTFLAKHPENTFPGQVSEFEPNHKLTIGPTAGPTRGTKISYSMEPIGGETKLTETIDLKVAGFTKLLWPFISRRTLNQGKVETESNVGNVKRILESEAQTVPIH